MLAKSYSASVVGIDGYLITIEVDISDGLPQIALVGLPDMAVKEAKDRVRAAVRNSGYTFPAKRITINLAPADTKKEGSTYDLPIALGLLAANGAIPIDALHNLVAIGELSLDGAVQPVHGVLPMVLGIRHLNRSILVPRDNAAEASVVSTGPVYPVASLREVVQLLNREITIPETKSDLEQQLQKYSHYDLDLADVRGQYFVKRALEVAVAGNHNLLFIGPPGSGKTMLSRRIPTILPSMSPEESLETTKLYSISGLLPKHQALVAQRPFRSPHHTASDIALIGGGSNPKPGEVSLSHNGILFLDELPEFNRKVLETLRQPLEDGFVTVSRAVKSLTFPSRFMLVCAMNPCPCGYYTHPTKECRCLPHRIEQYRSKVSGPLLDRIDIHVEVPPVNYKELMDEPAGETSAQIRERVEACREIQRERFKKSKIFANAYMSHSQIKKHCALDEASKNLLRMAVDELGLSGRAYDKILKVARTIADLAGAETITQDHLAEAIQYRSLDKNVLN